MIRAPPATSAAHRFLWRPGLPRRALPPPTGGYDGTRRPRTGPGARLLRVWAVDVDGAEYGPAVTHGLPVPLLLVGHESSCVAALCAPADASDRADLAVARSLVTHSHGHAWSDEIDGTEHFAFTYYAAYYLPLPLRLLLPLGRVDGDRALRTTSECLARFLGASFDGAPATRPLRRVGDRGVPVRACWAGLSRRIVCRT